MAYYYFTKKIFSGGIPPTNNISQFGSLRDGNANYSDDPDIIQNLDAWLEGLESALISGKYPTIQDINALIYVVSRQLTYNQQAGLPEWNENVTYYIGHISRDSDCRIYKSLTNDNIGNALTDPTNWFLIYSPVMTDMTDSFSLTNLDQNIVFSTTDPLTTKGISLPIPSVEYTGRKVLVYNKTCSYGISVYIGSIGSGYTFNTTPAISSISISSSGVTYPKYAHFICDGSDWWCLNNNSSFGL